MTTHDDQLETVTKIMRDARIAVLTYVSREGALVSTPMGAQGFEHPGTTWFLTEQSSEKVQALEADPRVNVAYSSDAGWVSLSGTAHVEQNRGKVEDLWDASSGAFMSGSPEDPGNIALRIDGTTAEYWESPGKVTAAVQLAKGLVTDKQPDLGDSGTVQL
ncbi:MULTISPECIES: pyridoxamine 5'-phosphate oxidase family protein [Aeromicrobium]|uniref:pyridoxamine 5'-phosphate oxidase family protein n=1 Tax=Aeromicrobium TaxID=2040 RepID=UPI001CA32F22|nr:MULTISPECIES: pyridoxamine 5'-phosphate oxidase family protein [Aeromicrobium]MCL3839157.1 pyridoxamine 5'-phosphate oxidase family protein [Aeromicrobium duanguangcaii]